MEEYVEKTVVQEMKEEEKKETDEEIEKVLKEFEADIWFRTQIPKAAEVIQEHIPSFVQAKTAYQTVAEFDKITKDKTILAHKKA
ncbi:MAG: hypothetical protein HFG70_12940 [Hungatella sp.]|nr:hypothetical protein [Hungatella sp.]